MLYDYLIVGGGIVGLSTAWQLKQRLPDAAILLVEKESDFAHHQTGHNSGVIHAGVYYQPGSLKAEFCRRGVGATMRFCDEEGIAYDQCGKLLVATNAEEHDRMQALHKRCAENQLQVSLLDQDELKEREPNITGTGAIHVPTTGIVNYAQVARAMARRFEAAGGDLKLETRVAGLREGPDEVVVETNRGDYRCRNVITCPGIHADRVLRMLGVDADFRMVPFRGEYYQLPPQMNDIVRHLIYPIPDPALPFLGVHLTRMIDGSVTVGPNAVLGRAREGYSKTAVNLRDLLEIAAYPGFWRLVGNYWRSGLAEFGNSLNKSGYLEQVRKYCPQVALEDLRPYPAGIRAQAVSPDGQLIHDFLFRETRRSLNVCNAPSPAATSAIPIGEHIVEKAISHFGS